MKNRENNGTENICFSNPAMKKCRKVQNRIFHNSSFNYHRSTKLTSKHIFSVTNEIKLVMKFLVITKRLKIEDGRNYDQETVQDAKSNDVRFLIVLYTCQNCFGLPHMSLWQICLLPATILGYMASQWPFSICRPKRLWKKKYGISKLSFQLLWICHMYLYICVFWGVKSG